MGGCLSRDARGPNRSFDSRHVFRSLLLYGSSNRRRMQGLARRWSLLPQLQCGPAVLPSYSFLILQFLVFYTPQLGCISAVHLCLSVPHPVTFRPWRAKTLHLSHNKALA